MKLAASMKPENKKMAKYPDTIQFPITYKCNYDCVMCGMRSLIGLQDMTVDELSMVLSDKLYRKVKSVGINGGEPFLRKDLDSCIETICEKLPALESLFFITNGYFSERIVEKMNKIYKICKKKRVRVDLSLSIDGVRDMQNFMRGNKNAWKNMQNTISLIQASEEPCCDSLNVICTITKYNIYRISEVELWAKNAKINVNYNIATINARINNYDKFEDFTIFNDKNAKYLTQEFFYKKFLETKSPKYYGLFLFVRDETRYAPCPCMKNKWVTLTPDGQVGYCATHSKNLGSALTCSSYDIFSSNIDYLKELLIENCETCSHYMYSLDKKGKKMYYNELIRFNK